MSNKKYFSENIYNIDSCSNEIYEMLINEPSILFIGAGISISAGLPSARQFCQQLITQICNSTSVANFAKKNDIDLSNFNESTSEIDFDTLLGLLKRSGSNNLEMLVKCFKEGNPNNITYQILNICKELNIQAIFTTNFDLILEKTASELKINYKNFTSNTDFPSNIIPSDPLPIFKIHGCPNTSLKPNELGIDFTEIGKDRSSQRGNLLKKYLESHSVLILGYGGADFWDIYPILYSYSLKNLIWIDYKENSDVSVTRHIEAYNSLVLRDHIDRLIAAWPNRYRIKVNTALIIERISSKIGKNLPKVNRKDTMEWVKIIDEWIKSKTDSILVDLGFLYNSLGDFENAIKAFDFYIDKDSYERNHYSLAIAYEGKGSAFYRNQYGVSHAAVDDFKLAKQTAKSIGNLKLLSWILLEEAIFIGATASSEKSINTFIEALKTASKSNYEECVGFCYANLGKQFASMEQNEKSEHFYKKAIIQFRKISNYPQVSCTLFNYADMIYGPLSRTIDIHKALPLYLESLSLIWGKNIFEFNKIILYSRIIVCLKFLFESGVDVIEYINSKHMLQVSGLAEHLTHFISEFGFKFSGPGDLENWQHKMRSN